MEIRKIGIVGQGALGVMYGNYLTKKLGNEHVFFIADEGRVKPLPERGYGLQRGSLWIFIPLSGGGGDGGSHYLCREVHGNGERASRP